jgi:hypothetical protein
MGPGLHGNTRSSSCQSVQKDGAALNSAAPYSLVADRQPVKRGAALRRGFAALHTLNDLCVVVT